MSGNPLRHRGGEPLGVGNVQELVRAVRIALGAQHAAHHHLGGREAGLQQVHQRDGAALADEAHGQTELGAGGVVERAE